MVWTVFLNFGEKFKYMKKNIIKTFRIPLQYIGAEPEAASFHPGAQILYDFELCSYYMKD